MAAAVGCYDAMNPTRETRQRLLKADSYHDYADKSRIIDILTKWSKKKKIVLDDEAKQKAYDYIVSILNSYITVVSNECGIVSNNENHMIESFYGTDSIDGYEFNPDTPFNINIINNSYPPIYPPFNNKVVSFQGIHLQKWVLYMYTVLFPNKQYVLDHTALSQNVLCSEMKGYYPPILETIAKAYDRASVLPSTYYQEQGSSPRIGVRKTLDGCSEIKEDAFPSILTKKNGELLFFEQIDILNEHQLQWTLPSNITGIIDIERLDVLGSQEDPENLSAFVLDIAYRYLGINTLFVQGINEFIEYAYGFSLAIVDNDPYLYSQGLMEFKRMGDLLQVKLAQAYNAVFVSNDRMAVLMAAIGYKIPAMRTYVHREGSIYNYKMSVYNTPLDESVAAAAMEAYRVKMMEEYTNTIRFYMDIINVYNENIKPSLQIIKNTFNDIITGLRGFYNSIVNVPILIDIDTDLEYILDSNGNPIRANKLTLNHLNMDALINRAIYVILKYLLILNQLIIDRIPLVTELTDISKLRDFFKEQRIPQPNTIFKYVSKENIQLSIETIYNLMRYIHDNLLRGSNPKELLKVIIDVIKSYNFSLFGDNLKTYIINIQRIIDTKVTPYSINGYKIGMIKGVKELVSNLNDFETYVNSLCIEYGTCMDYGYGGRRKSKSNRSKTIKMKRGGYINDIEMTDLLQEKSNMVTIPNFKPLPPLEAPIDLIELTLAQLIYDVSRASKENVQNLFIVYIQLQLITQQYNMNLIIFDKANEEEMKTIPDISKVTQYSKGFINKIRSQLNPQQIFKRLQKPIISITTNGLTSKPLVAPPAGGNKKSKSKAKVQPVKGGKSKKDEVKKEVKAKKKPATDKKKSK